MKKLIFLFSFFMLISFSLQAKRPHSPVIIGDDDREDITGKASKSERATVVIRVPKYDDEVALDYTSWCSGAMVAPNIVLTAAHCISDVEDVGEVEVYAVGMSKPESSHNEHNNALKADSLKVQNTKSDDTNLISDTIQLNNSLKNTIKKQMAQKGLEQTTWIYNESGEEVYPYATARKLWVPKEYTDAVINTKKNKKLDVNKIHYDYGFIVLDYNLGDIIGQLKLKIISGEEWNGTNIVVIGRGGDKEKYSLWKSPGSIKRTDEYVLYYDADTVEGNSGGPVLEADNPKNIIAVDDWEYVPEDVSLSSNVGLLIRQEIIDAVKNLEKEISSTNKK